MVKHRENDERAPGRRRIQPSTTYCELKFPQVAAHRSLHRRRAFDVMKRVTKLVMQRNTAARRG